MKNPCYGCEMPKRYPGCHDRCAERKQYIEKVLIPQREYKKETYSWFDNDIYTRYLRKKASHK